MRLKSLFVSLILALPLAKAHGSFTLVEDFQTLPAGNIDGHNGWVSSGSAGQVSPDPIDPANQVLAVSTTGANIYKPLNAQRIQNNTIGTLFFRMRRADNGVNVSAGLSDRATPTSAFFGDYEAQLNCNTQPPDNLNVRDAGAFDTVDTFEGDIWYSVWMVIDNMHDLTTVYMKGGALSEQTLLTGNSDGETAFTFRNTTGDGFNTNTSPVGNDLVTVLFMTTGGQVGPFYVDDIYIDTDGNNLSSPYTDISGPVVIEVQPAAGSTVAALSSVSVRFSEPVTNVIASDLLVNDSPATSLTGADANWTFSFPTPPAGTVTVTWASEQNIMDLASNRFGSTALAWVFTNVMPDVTPPTVATVTPAPGRSVSNLSEVQVAFSEPVMNLYPEDLLVNGIPATQASIASNTYIFTFSPPPPGSVSLSFAPGHGITDAAGNRLIESAPTNRWNYTLVDATPPVVASMTPAAGAAITRLDGLQVYFSKPVTGVDAGDLLMNGALATNVTGTGLGPYFFSFPQPTAGTVQFQWATANGIRDIAAIPNAFVGGSWTNKLVAPDTLGRVIINEFLANNVTGLINEFGDQEDWIELYNTGTNAVHLLGWSLTDDPKNPGLWTFPDLTLDPDQYLLVFADGRDLKALGGTNQLHTNFKLNDQGDYLGLYNADLPRTVESEFTLAFPEQRPDYSYGLTSTNTWSYFVTPTPGGPNGDSSITGVVPMPHVSASRGLYDYPFTLVASCPLAEATLRYTSDGSEPTEGNGHTYTGPLTIDHTTILRLAAFAPNRLPSRVDTHSYIFTDQTLTQPNDPPGYPSTWGTFGTTTAPSDYEMDPEVVTNNPKYVKEALQALPTLSIAISIDDMFGPVNGIYTHPEPPTSERYLWERPCSAEFILTNGQTGFNIDCGIRIQGNASRTPIKTPKHPFRLLFKGAYGPGRLDYPVYADSPVQSLNTLVLRADFNNSWVHWDGTQRLRGSKVRDAWTKDTFREMNGISGHSRPFHLYINGIYWGVYDFGERIDADFAASYLGGTSGDWDALASKPTEAIDGDLEAYNQMVAIGRDADMTQLANYDLIKQYLDMPIFLDYTILNLYGANLDWGFDSNWNVVHRRAPGETFKYLTWDGEQLVVDLNDNRVSSTDVPSGLHTNLIHSLQYRMDFADRVQKYCFNGGILTPGPAAHRWMKRAHEVEPGMLAESARWGDYRRDVEQYSSGPYLLYTTNEHWWPEIERMRTNYFPYRTDVFLQQLRAAGLYPTVDAPVFNQQGGRVERGFTLTMTAADPIYYTTNGVDPRVYGSGTIAGEARLYQAGQPLALDSSTIVKARALFGNNWSALNEATFTVEGLLPALHITEIMYNPQGGDAYEFLELRNDEATPLDVSGWSFSGITYAFNADTFLAPGQVIVLANSANPAAFAERYPGVNVFGYFGGRLDNGGERIAIQKPTGEIVLAVTYGDSGGWPKEADGLGYSLEMIDPAGDPNAPSNWRATSFNGTSRYCLTQPRVRRRPVERNHGRQRECRTECRHLPGLG